MIPDRSTTKVPRLEMPASSLNTPYAWLTAPCGQKSDNTGNVNPLWVAQILWVGGGPTEIATTALSSFSKFRQVIAQLVQLTLADPGERQREEHQQHVLGAAVSTESDGLLILVAQREVGGGGSDVEHQRCFPARDFGWTNRLALQSPRLTDEVGIRPAVGADSAISAGST